MRPHPPGRQRGRWSTWVAISVLIAVAWPSLGPLPWLAPRFLTPSNAAAHAHADDGRALHHQRHVDASAIPGSPTHPADHDCFECQVLKHLSRCILDTPALDFFPSLAVCEIAAPVVLAHPRTRLAAILPPVRAPPAVV